MFPSPLRQFYANESGAVTVDWVVITAGILIFGILLTSMIASGVNDTSTGLGARLGETDMHEITFD